jgi:hypothetical protein
MAQLMPIAPVRDGSSDCLGLIPRREMGGRLEPVTKRTEFLIFLLMDSLLLNGAGFTIKVVVKF